jgi:hypothetical protein
MQILPFELKESETAQYGIERLVFFNIGLSRIYHQAGRDLESCELTKVSCCEAAALSSLNLMD